jgi:hypothetical protein
MLSLYSCLEELGRYLVEILKNVTVEQEKTARWPSLSLQAISNTNYVVRGAAVSRRAQFQGSLFVPNFKRTGTKKRAQAHEQKLARAPVEWCLFRLGSSSARA